ncbi:MAG: hypothetical protein WD876_01845 [Candidatus Pacearchaeota archaeon]
MDKTIILYIIVGLLLAGLLVFTFFPGVIYAVKDSGITGDNTADKCKPEPGYTEESWKEHMSHHPNIYQECLT